MNSQGVVFLILKLEAIIVFILPNFLHKATIEFQLQIITLLQSTVQSLASCSCIHDEVSRLHTDTASFHSHGKEQHTMYAWTETDE